MKLHLPIALMLGLFSCQALAESDNTLVLPTPTIHVCSDKQYMSSLLGLLKTKQLSAENINLVADFVLKCKEIIKIEAQKPTKAVPCPNAEAIDQDIESFERNRSSSLRRHIPNEEISGASYVEELRASS